MGLEAMLSVRNGAKAVEFYKVAFGAEEIFSAADPTGAVIAQLKFENTTFWLSDESPEHQNYSPESLGGGTVRMILTVYNPDAVFDKAVSAGATSICPVRDEPYGWRIGRVLDPFGHHWEIGKLLKK
jgi:PhnB protein